MTDKERGKAKLILALGSNCDQEENIGMAMTLLQKSFGGDMKFTRRMWTEAIGIKSDFFLNCLASVHTPSDFESIQKTVKGIEAACGDNKDDRKRNIIRVDIDILLLGDKKYHDNDWSRKYIKELVNELI